MSDCKPAVLFSTAYLAPVSYYAYLMHAPQVYVEQHEHYRKQTYRNRCQIMAANGPMALSIPVITCNNQNIRSVKIDYSKPWQRQHWLSLESAYRSTPFFEYYQDDLKPFYQQQEIDCLFDFNARLQEVICDLVDIHPQVCLTEDFVMPKADEALLGVCVRAGSVCCRPHANPAKCLDLRNLIHPKKSMVALPSYCEQKYTQVFEQQYGFLPHLSMVDLLFNMGPESILVLRDSFL